MLSLTQNRQPNKRQPPQFVVRQKNQIKPTSTTLREARCLRLLMPNPSIQYQSTTAELSETKLRRVMQESRTPHRMSMMPEIEAKRWARVSLRLRSFLQSSIKRIPSPPLLPQPRRLLSLGVEIIQTMLGRTLLIKPRKQRLMRSLEAAKPRISCKFKWFYLSHK